VGIILTFAVNSCALFICFIQQSREKSLMNGTPKKNGSSNGKGIGNLIENKDASPPIPNLRLEAKMTAEVSYLATMNSREKKVFIYIYI